MALMRRADGSTAAWTDDVKDAVFPDHGDSLLERPLRLDGTSSNGDE